MRPSAAGTDSMPYLSKTQIKREAAVLLCEYGGRHGPVLEPPVPAEEVLELHLGVGFELADLRARFGFGDVLGAVWFAEKMVRVDEGLDPALFPKLRGRYRFTLAHEVGHWRLHRHLFVEDPAQGRMFDGAAKPAYVCRSGEAKKPVEWQVDYFAAHLLMPSPLVRAAWEAWRGGPNSVTLSELRKGSGAAEPPDALFEYFVRPLAGRFEVSAGAMRIRLEELGLLLKGGEGRLF